MLKSKHLVSGNRRGYFFIGLMIVIAVLLAYRQTVISLLDVWFKPDNPTYSHGPLLLLASLVLLYTKTQQSDLRVRFGANAIGTLLLLGFSGLWFLAVLAQVQIVQYIALIFIVLLIYCMLFGFRALPVFAMPVLLLLFAVPFWEVFYAVLQWLTVLNVEWMLRVVGISVISEGVYIHVPAGVFEVEEGCSGLGQFIVAGAIGVIFADRLKLGICKFVAVVLAAFATAVLSNILRVFIVVVAGQLTDMQHRFVKDHYDLGWVLFAIILFAFLYLVSKYVGAGSVEAGGHLQKSDTYEPVRRYDAPLGAAVVLFVLAGLSGPVLLSIYEARAAGQSIDISQLPKHINHWQSDIVEVAPWQSAVVGYDNVRQQVYSKGKNESVRLLVYDYFNEQSGQEATGYGNNIYDAKQVTLLNSRQLQEDQLSGSLKSARQMLFDMGDRGRTGHIQRVVLFWYQVAGVGTSNELCAKLLGLWGKLTRQPLVSIVVVVADVKTTEQAARTVVQTFANDLVDSNQLEVLFALSENRVMER